MKLPEPRLWYDPETQQCSSMAPLRPTFEPMFDAEDLRAAVTAERERCAKVCRDKADEWLDRAHAGWIAEDTKRHALIAAGLIEAAILAADT